MPRPTKRSRDDREDTTSEGSESSEERCRVEDEEDIEWEDLNGTDDWECEP